MKRIWSWLMLFVRFCITVILRLFRVSITDEKWAVIEQFIKFVLVGLSNALITLLVYYAIILVFGKASYMIGQTIGYIAGIFNSYFWNSRFVFSAAKKKARSFLKMCICYGMTYFLQAGLLYVFVTSFCLSEYLSPILAILITTPVNFGLNKLWAFRNSSS